MEESNEALVYTVRPDQTALWLPASLAQALGVKRGDRLTADQYNGFAVRSLIQERLQAQDARRGR